MRVIEVSSCRECPFNGLEPILLERGVQTWGGLFMGWKKSRYKTNVVRIDGDIFRLTPYCKKEKRYVDPRTKTFPRFCPLKDK